MRLIKSATFIIVLSLPEILVAQADHKHSVQNLQKDFNIFRGALEESHAGIYWYRSKAEMDGYFNEAYKALNREMTELEFYRLIAPVVSKIGCGHTWIATTEPTQEKIWDQGKVLPLKLKIIDGRAYCIQNNSSDSAAIQPGDEILSINQYSVDSLLKLSSKFSPGDGFVEVGKWRVLDNVFNQFFTLYIEMPDEYRIKFRKQNGELCESVIQPMTLPAVESMSKKRYLNKKEGQDGNITLKVMEESSSAVLRVKEFDDWKINGKTVKFRQVLQRSFQTLDSLKTRNLIIDVRDNDGGNEKYGLELYSYLTDKPFIGYRQIDFRTTRFNYRKYSNTSWLEYSLIKTLLRHKRINDTTYILKNDKATREVEPKAKPFKGSVYILINRGCFSTTSDFTALAHHNKIGKFVGEETGGSYSGNTSNYTLLITLPHTKIKINIPVARYVTNVSSAGQPGQGTLPDYWVTYSIEDVIKGADKDMEAVFELIKKDKSK